MKKRSKYGGMLSSLRKLGQVLISLNSEDAEEVDITSPHNIMDLSLSLCFRKPNLGSCMEVLRYWSSETSRFVHGICVKFRYMYQTLISPPVCLSFTSLSLPALTSLSISQLIAQHQASLSNLLLALNSTNFLFADNAGMSLGAFRSGGGATSSTVGACGRYHTMKSISSSGSSVSNPS